MYVLFPSYITSLKSEDQVIASCYEYKLNKGTKNNYIGAAVA